MTKRVNTNFEYTQAIEKHLITHERSYSQSHSLTHTHSLSFPTPSLARLTPQKSYEMRMNSVPE